MHPRPCPRRIRLLVPAALFALGVAALRAHASDAPASWSATAVDARTAGDREAHPRSGPVRALVLADSLAVDSLAADSLEADSLDALIRAAHVADSLRAAGRHGDSLRAAPAAGVPSAPAARRAGADSLERWLRDVTVAPAPGPDTLHIAWEAGASTDVSNEQFYEDLVDTTFLGRRLVNTPDSRYALVGAYLLDGTRADRAVRVQLHNEVSLGNELQRDALDLVWRDERSPHWRWLVLPRLEFRRDQTFDRDFTEWHGETSARARRRIDGTNTEFDLGASGEVLESAGAGRDFLLDRNAGTVSAGIERAPLFGEEWRAGYAFSARQFPDSSVRNHYEHGWETRWRHPLAGLGWLAAECDGERRTTVERAPTTRDNFWHERAALAAERSLDARWRLDARLEGEATQYDVQDSALYFNDRVLRAEILPRLQGLSGWSLGVGPRAEWLWSPFQAGEEYDEYAAVAEIEALRPDGWWSLSPAWGYRSYRRPLEQHQFAIVGLHTSYAFVECDVVGDQHLPGALRLRAFVSGRLESHTDAADDARSLYFSLDLRRLF